MAIAQLARPAATPPMEKAAAEPSRISPSSAAAGPGEPRGEEEAGCCAPWGSLPPSPGGGRPMSAAAAGPGTPPRTEGSLPLHPASTVSAMLAAVELYAAAPSAGGRGWEAAFGTRQRLRAVLSQAYLASIAVRLVHSFPAFVAPFCPCD